MTTLDPWDHALKQALEPGDGQLVDLAELARRSDIALPILEAVAREGFLLPRRTDPNLYDPEDAAVVIAGLALVEAGLPIAELFDLARQMDRAMRPVAEQAVEAFARFVRDSVEATSTTPDEAAGRLVTAFETMLPLTGRMVGHHFRRLVIEAARRRLEG